MNNYDNNKCFSKNFDNNSVMINNINTIKIISVKYLNGRNIWSKHPCLEVLIDIGEFEKYPSNKIDNLYKNIRETFPSMINHRCSYGENGGFFKRLEEGTYFGHILEHIALELQNYTCFDGGLGRTRETEISGIYKISLTTHYDNRKVIEKCFFSALQILITLIQNKKVDLRNYMDEIIDLSNKYSIGPSTNEIISNLPYKIPYFNIEVDNLLQLGYGINSKMIYTSITCSTIGISESISSDKIFTKKLLSNQGISVPIGELCNNINDIYKVIEKIGYPIVIKPCNSNRSNGCTLNITNDKKILYAFNYALENNKNNRKDVMVEKYIDGNSYRLLLVNNEIVACCKITIIKRIDRIIGDGKSSILQLIKDINAVNLLNTHYLLLDEENIPEEMIIELDRYHYEKYLIDYLNEKKFQLNTILEKNYKLIIERKFDKFTNIDFNLLNKDIINKCKLATNIINLDICGIDLIIKDITKPLTNENGVILELNSSPDLVIHRNSKISVGEKIIKYMFNDKSDGLIPIIGITGDGNYKFVNEFIRKFFVYEGKYVGSYGKNGFYLNNKKFDRKNNFDYESIKQILINKNVEIAIFDTDSKTILDEGIFYKYCNGIFLGNINNIDSKKTLINEQYNSVKVHETLMYNIPENGYCILNADDKNINKLIELCDCNIIFYTNIKNNLNNLFNNKLLSEHSKNNGKIIFIDNDNNLVLYENYKEINLFNINNIIFNKINENDIMCAIGGIWSCQDIFKENIKEKFNIFLNNHNN